MPKPSILFLPLSFCLVSFCLFPHPLLSILSNLQSFCSVYDFCSICISALKQGSLNTITTEITRGVVIFKVNNLKTIVGCQCSQVRMNRKVQGKGKKHAFRTKTGVTWPVPHFYLRKKTDASSKSPIIEKTQICKKCYGQQGQT